MVFYVALGVAWEQSFRRKPKPRQTTRNQPHWILGCAGLTKKTSPSTRLPHEVGCRPPGGNVRHENYMSALEPRVVWLFSVGYRRRNRPAVG